MTETQTGFQAAYRYHLLDPRKKNWQMVVKTICDFTPGSVFTIHDLMEKTDIDRTNLLHIIGGTGKYRNCPSLRYGKYRILEKLINIDEKIAYYKVNEKRREELISLLL